MLNVLPILYFLGRKTNVIVPIAMYFINAVIWLVPYGYMWQQQWDHTTKGLANKEFFPNIKNRLKTKINLTPNFTAMTTAHGKTRSYLHRFRIIESPECPCANGNQRVYHLLYQCNKLKSEREALIGYISKEDNWPVKEKPVSDQISKTVYQFYKLNWLR